MHNHPDAFIEDSFVLTERTIYSFVKNVCSFATILPCSYIDKFNVDFSIKSQYRVVNDVEADIIDKIFQLKSDYPNLELYQIADVMETHTEALRILKIDKLLT